MMRHAVLSAGIDLSIKLLVPEHRLANRHYPVGIVGALQFHMRGEPMPVFAGVCRGELPLWLGQLELDAPVASKGDFVVAKI